MNSLVKNILFSVLVLFSLSMHVTAQDKPMNLRDSLLQKFTEKELHDMTSEQRYIEILLLRGKYEEAKQKERLFEERDSLRKYNQVYDRYGIPWAYDIPVVQETKRIDSLVQFIDSNKGNFRQEVFPNTYFDLYDIHHSRMYKNFVNREPAKNFNQIVKEVELDVRGNESAGFDSKECNYTRRTYYFDEFGELKLIEIRLEPDVNKEAKAVYDYTGIYVGEVIYYHYRQYVHNDSLIYIDYLKVSQGLKKLAYEYFERSEIMEEPVYIDGDIQYFFKSNAFNMRELSGKPLRKDWKEWLKNQEYEKVNYSKPNNSGVFEFRNRVLEYQEYHEEINKYLHPIYCSELQPFIIEP